ncbi:MAG TPA: MurR/RpiR family transcriptional regulator [Candidatus Sulfotelmatobacter sp.]|nr:MurR/RpiR family transcriptional regulator [Candidatus Sulfotelmatobacter sp.]
MGSRAKDGSAGIPGNGNLSERKPWMTALEQRLAHSRTNLSNSRIRLLENILENAEENHFLSSRALAKRYAVDKATIVRSVQVLGYKKYAEFAADLRAHFVSRITPYTLMKSASREKRSIADHVAHSLEIEVNNLQALRASLDPDDVVEMAKRLNRARRIVVVGVDFAAALAYLLAYGLVSLGYNAEAPVGSAGSIHQKISLLGPKDLLIAISFGRCLQATVDAVLHARQNAVPTFGITDSDKTPIARFCDFFWIASIANPSFHGSYVAPLAAMDTLFVACAHLQPKRALAMLRRKDLDSRSRWYSQNPDRKSVRGGAPEVEHSSEA